MLEAMSRLFREYQDKLSPPCSQPQQLHKGVIVTTSKDIIIIDNNNNNDEININVNNIIIKNNKIDNNNNKINVIRIENNNNNSNKNNKNSNDIKINNFKVDNNNNSSNNNNNNNSLKICQHLRQHHPKNDTSNNENNITSTKQSNKKHSVKDSLILNDNNNVVHEQNNYIVPEKYRKKIWDDYPYTSEELGIMPVSKFNDSLHLLDEYRIHLARDIRRKFKNKIAARNCRKRKIQHIDRLDTGVDSLESRLDREEHENKALKIDIEFLHNKMKRISECIFQQLRDTNGMRYSKRFYSLVFSRDDNEVFLVPLNNKTTGRTSGK